MVYIAGDNSELHILQKTQTCTYFSRCQMSWPVWVETCHTLGTLGNTARKSPYHESKQQWLERYSRWKGQRQRQ